MALSLAETFAKYPARFTSVDRRANLSLAEFWAEYHIPRRPVVITDQASLFKGVDWESTQSLCSRMDVVPTNYRDVRRLPFGDVAVGVSSPFTRSAACGPFSSFLEHWFGVLVGDPKSLYG